MWKKDMWGDWSAEIGPYDGFVTNAGARKTAKRPWRWQVCRGKEPLLNGRALTADGAKAEAERMMRAMQ